MPVKYSALDASPLPFLHLLGVLKHLDRTGWKRWLKHPESVAAHMYRLSFLVMSAPEGVDKQRCVWIALCHDIAESFAGDIPTYDPMSKDEKYKLEDFGIRYIESLLQIANPKLGADIRAGWEEYENGNTLEATQEGKWVLEMDKFECMIQALEYGQETFGEKNLDEFQGQAKYIKSEEGRNMLELLQEERKAHSQKRRRGTPVIFVIGTAGVKKQCNHISRDFSFQHITLQVILEEKARDNTYLHSKFLSDCLEQGVKVPTQLVVSLLEQKINEGIQAGEGWYVVDEFPDSMERLLEFKQKVQKSTYTLFLRGSSEKTSEGSLRRGDEESDIVNHLRGEDGYFKEIDGDKSDEEVHALVRNAVEEFMRHSLLGK